MHGSPVTTSHAPRVATPAAAQLQITFISAWWHPSSIRVPDTTPIVSRRHDSPPHSSPPPRGPPL
jgi:hypothetical protein